MLSILSILIIGCLGHKDVEYLDYVGARPFIDGNIIDEGVVYTPQQFKNKLLSKCITDSIEIRRRTIQGDFLIKEIYMGKGGLFGYVAMDTTTFLEYEILSVSTTNKNPRRYSREIRKGKVYSLSIIPYYDRPEQSMVWERHDYIYIDGKLITPAYKVFRNNIYTSPNINGIYYLKVK